MKTDENKHGGNEGESKPTSVVGFARAVKAMVDDYLLMRRVDRLLAEGYAKQGKRKPNL